MQIKIKIFTIFTLLACTFFQVNILSAQRLRDRRMPLPRTDIKEKFASFQSVNYPDRYIRHANFKGLLSPLSTGDEKKDGTFKMVKGLDASCSDCISFESVNYPGKYLRHQNFEIKLMDISTDSDRKDATFKMVPGLAGSGVSFQSVNYPKRYIRHDNFVLYINEPDNSNSFVKDATFLEVEPLNAPQTVAPVENPRFHREVEKLASFKSVNYPDRYIRHANFKGLLSPLATADEKKDGTFKIVKGLDASCPDCISFESTNYPGKYLRHQNFEIKLMDISTEGDKKDATFKMIPGLAGKGVSFQSVNYPDRYIRHNNFILYLNKPDNSNSFSQDASFEEVGPL